MKYITTLLLAILLIGYSGLTWAATCEYCYQLISKGEKYCEECKLKSKPARDISGMETGEEQIVDTSEPSRGLHGMELVEEQTITNISIRPARDIEVANYLFQDGKMYKKSLCFFNKGSKLLFAIKRFKMIINDYGESDKADDAAYELARIYNGFYFKDYAGAAHYYVTCYELNPDTDKPARYMAARVYDKHLKDYPKAVQNYEMALQTCRVERYRKKTQKRLDKLRKKGF
ncbi:MAG: tol-pal system YbgF family protein [Candidatus Scalinduaceae bacterium]